MHEWSSQRYRREKEHGVSRILAIETSESLARKAYLASRKKPDSNLLSRGTQARVTSSTIVFPNGLPNDPGLAQKVREISGVLQQVNDQYFPRIDFLNFSSSETQMVLYFGAYGMRFRVGIVLGTNGEIVEVVFVLDTGQKIGPFTLEYITDLRDTMNVLGAFLGGR